MFDTYGHHRRRLGGQPFLGQPGLLAHPGQRSKAQRAGRVGIVGVGDSGHHVVEQGLVDLITGKVGIANGLADRELFTPGPRLQRGPGFAAREF